MDLSEYKNKHPKHSDRLTKIERMGKKAEIILDLKNHEGIKILLQDLANAVNDINTKLLTYKKLGEVEREILLTDKERCMWLSRELNIQEEVINKTNSFLKKLKI